MTGQIVILRSEKILPWKMSVDMRIIKRIHLGNIVPAFYIDVNNLFDRKNTIRIADEEWYFAKDDPQGKYGNPTVFDRGRLTRIGLRIDF